MAAFFSIALGIGRIEGKDEGLFITPFFAFVIKIAIFASKNCVNTQNLLAIPDADKQQQEQRSLTLTDDAFTKIILTTDNTPTHTLDNGIIMMNVFEYLLA